MRKTESKNDKEGNGVNLFLFLSLFVIVLFVGAFYSPINIKITSDEITSNVKSELPIRIKSYLLLPNTNTSLPVEISIREVEHILKKESVELRLLGQIKYKNEFINFGATIKGDEVKYRSTIHSFFLDPISIDLELDSQNIINAIHLDRVEKSKKEASIGLLLLKKLFTRKNKNLTQKMIEKFIVETITRRINNTPIYKIANPSYVDSIFLEKITIHDGYIYVHYTLRYLFNLVMIGVLLISLVIALLSILGIIPIGGIIGAGV